MTQPPCGVCALPATCFVKSNEGAPIPRCDEHADSQPYFAEVEHYRRWVWDLVRGEGPTDESRLRERLLDALAEEAHSNRWSKALDLIRTELVEPLEARAEKAERALVEAVGNP